ncbi:MAG: c-type cytochrome biogenesis protein CcsB [Desulfobacterales bacterium]|jgi:cytochrome c-type biogenesis protein CcsB|nr:c-type cytochrome biogenesis protein CcsB [Desulfobacterales bacterium]
MAPIFILIIVLYLTSSIGYLAFLFSQKESFHRISYGLLLAGFLAHTGLIAYKMIILESIPVHNLHQTLSFAAWALAGVYLFLKYKFRLNILGLYAAPLAAFIMVAVYWIPEAPGAHGELFKNLWLILHVVIIFIGEAALALACGTGILYLIQDHAIKSKTNRFFHKRLPSLEFLDVTGYVFIFTGFTLLTIGLITGFIYAQQVWGRFWSWDPKEIWSGITWLIYAALLHERLVAGWRGRRAAIMAIIGFAAVIFTFLGVNLFLEGHHETFTK